MTEIEKLIESLKIRVVTNNRSKALQASLLAWVEYAPWSPRQVDMVNNFVKNNPTEEESIQIQILAEEKAIFIRLEREKVMLKKEFKAITSRIKRYINGILGIAERRELLKRYNLKGNATNVEMYTALSIDPNLANANNLSYIIWEELKLKQVI